MCHQIDGSNVESHVENFSPPTLPTPTDFHVVYLDVSDRDGNEEEEDHDEVVGGRPYMFELATR